MPLFQYKARGSRGDAIEGTMEAVDSDAVAAQLLESGVTPVDIFAARSNKRTSGAGQLDLSNLFPVQVRQSDIIQFTRQMHSLTKAGVPMLSALHGLSQSTRNTALAKTVSDIKSSLESGRDLATAFSEHPKIFSLFYVSMVRIGETTGQLDDIFLQLTRYLDRDQRTRAQIKAALRYPSFVIIAVLIAISIINFFVIPAFAGVYARFHADLPITTRIIVAMSDFSLAYWHIVIASVIAAIAAVRHYLNTEDGRYRWDKYKLKLPLAGDIIYRATLARFARLFAMSMRAGVPLITALNVVAKALDNIYVEERILGMQAGIERGETITRTASASGMFDALVIQMMSVGEETGSIDTLLTEAAEYYDTEVAFDIDKLNARIEPILTVLIAGIVLVLALSVFLPMWNLAEVAIR